MSQRSEQVRPAASPVQRVIDEHGIDAEIIDPGMPVQTVAQAAAALGVSEDQVLKSLVFQDRTGDLVLVIASGTSKVSRQKLAAVTRLDRPKLADAATVLAATGYLAGGVPPVGHRTPLRVVMDQGTAALAVAYGGGGTETLLLRIRPADILRLTGGQVADIADGGRG